MFIADAVHHNLIATPLRIPAIPQSVNGTTGRDTESYWSNFL